MYVYIYGRCKTYLYSTLLIHSKFVMSYYVRKTVNAVNKQNNSTNKFYLRNLHQILEMFRKVCINLVLVGLYFYFFGIKSINKFQTGGLVVNTVFLKDPEAMRIRPGLT